MNLSILVLPIVMATSLARAATTLALNWFPEAEHAGFYAADVGGLYKAAGIQVKLLPGGPGAPVLQQVATGRVDFGVSNADEVLIARAQGVPVVAVLAPIQTSPRVVMVHRASGITSLTELKNLTLAIEPQAPWASYLKRKAALTGVRFVPYGGSVAPFVADKSFAQQAYGISEPFVARQKGADPVSLYVSELGYNPYTSVLVVSEKTLRERPDLVRKVVQASQAGWELYLKQPQATEQVIHAANPQMDLPVLRFGHQELQSLCRNEDTNRLGIGAMTAARWQGLAVQLEEMGVVAKGKANAAKAWNGSFLKNP